MPEAVFILLLPPSFDELERRLRSRGTDSAEKIAGRLERAKKDLEYADRYDYIVINDSVDIAANEIRSIMVAEKCRTRDRIGLIKAKK